MEGVVVGEGSSVLDLVKAAEDVLGPAGGGRYESEQAAQPPAPRRLFRSSRHSPPEATRMTSLSTCRRTGLWLS